MTEKEITEKIDFDLCELNQEIEINCFKEKGPDNLGLVIFTVVDFLLRKIYDNNNSEK